MHASAGERFGNAQKALSNASGQRKLQPLKGSNRKSRTHSRQKSHREYRSGKMRMHNVRTNFSDNPAKHTGAGQVARWIEATWEADGKEGNALLPIRIPLLAHLDR